MRGTIAADFTAGWAMNALPKRFVTKEAVSGHDIFGEFTCRITTALCYHRLTTE